MLKRYKLINQDTFKKLELGKIYTLLDNKYIVNDEDQSIKIYYITKWQLKNMFKEVK